MKNNAKNYITKISLFLLVVVSVIFLGGCSGEYNLTLKENGVIEASINLDLGDLDSEIADKVIISLEEYFKQLDRAFERNTLELYSNIFNYEKLRENENLKEVYQIDTDKGLISYILEYNDFVVNDSRVEKLGKKVKFTKSFASMRTQTLERTLTAYYLYFYPKALEYSEEQKDIVLSMSYKTLMDDIPLSSSLERDADIFLTKIVQTSNPLYYNGEEPKFLENYGAIPAGTTLKEYIQSVTNMAGQQIDLMFNFSTPYNRVHSNGTVTQTKNGYTHSWVLGDVDSIVTFYRISARPIMWYILAICLAVLVLAVGLITGAIIKNNKKKIGMQALKKIDKLANGGK